MQTKIHRKVNECAPLLAISVWQLRIMVLRRQIEYSEDHEHAKKNVLAVWNEWFEWNCLKWITWSIVWCAPHEPADLGWDSGLRKHAPHKYLMRMMAMAERGYKRHSHFHGCLEELLVFEGGQCLVFKDNAWQLITQLCTTLATSKIKRKW